MQRPIIRAHVSHVYAWHIRCGLLDYSTNRKSRPNYCPTAKKTTTESERKKYQGMTGSLMFSMVETRPDIAFVTSVEAYSPRTQATFTQKRWRRHSNTWKAQRTEASCMGRRRWPLKANRTPYGRWVTRRAESLPPATSSCYMEDPVALSSTDAENIAQPG